MGSLKQNAVAMIPLFAEQISSILGGPPQRITPLHGGMIGEVYRVEMADKRTVVAKVAHSSQASLDVEGYMLRYLHERSQLPVPEVLYSDTTLLLLAFLPGRSHFSAAAQQHAAELLAALHSHTAPAFGMERDTLIATIPLPNSWTDSWVRFFREYRLLYLGQRAVETDRMPAPLLTRLEGFAARLETWLEEPDQPSLVHGDIWATNVLADETRITGFLDPAIYYGHAEVELAYITLFNTFGAPFFEHYHALRPIAPGFFEERCAIYNLYPLLVHVCEFGGGYVGSVESTLSSFGY